MWMSYRRCCCCCCFALLLLFYVFFRMLMFNFIRVLHYVASHCARTMVCVVCLPFVCRPLIKSKYVNGDNDGRFQSHNTSNTHMPYIYNLFIDQMNDFRIHDNSSGHWTDIVKWEEKIKCENLHLFLIVRPAHQLSEFCSIINHLLMPFGFASRSYN